MRFQKLNVVVIVDSGRHKDSQSTVRKLEILRHDAERSVNVKEMRRPCNTVERNDG